MRGLIEDWKQALHSNQPVDVLSTDMSKACDCLSHSLTVMKFFENRRNRIKLGEITSDWKPMKRGCPQESSFGPLLLNMFQNDLPLHVKNGNVTMYADDYQFHVTGNKSRNS